MKKLKFYLIAVLLFLGPTLMVTAQEHPSFVIINDGGVNNMPAYIAALNRNDLDKYRHINIRTVIEFESGVHVQLLSGNEMTQLGIPVNLSKVSAQPEEAMEGRFNHTTFILHPSGRILEKVSLVNQK